MIRIDKRPCVIISPANIFYLTGIRVSAGCLLISNQKSILFTSPLSLQRPISTEDVDVDFVKSGDELRRAFILLKEGAAVYTDLPLHLQQYEKKYNIKKLAKIYTARMTKHEQEIRVLWTAIKLSERALMKTLDILKEGVSEVDVKAELEYQMLKAGAEEKAFDTIVAFSENASYPHYFSSHSRKLKKGDAILIDWGARYRGYCADITRMILFGKVDELWSRWLTTVKSTVERIIEQLALGERRVVELNRIYKGMIGRRHILHSLGHGIGVEVHEAPFLNGKKVLKEGQVITIEPGAYAYGRFGVRIEEDIWVKKNSIEKLTNLEKIIVL